MSLARQILEFLETIPVWPVRMRLETEERGATVPMIRGVLGLALHELDREAYGRLFRPDEGGGGGPAGYLLRPAPPDPAFFPALEWILIGPAIDAAAIWQRAWDVASGMGLGPQRRPFFFRQRLELGPDGAPRPPTGPWPLAHARAFAPGDAAETPLRIVAPAPLRLLRDDALIERPTLADLVVAAGRRVRSFLPREQQRAWRTIADDALAVARRVPASPWQGEALDLVRYSGSQRREIELRGIAGSLELPSGADEVWPLLAAAQWLHLGKSTVVGLGQIVLVPLR